MVDDAPLENQSRIYDYFDKKWVEVPWVTPHQRLCRQHRVPLVKALIEEIRVGNGMTVLYASLLARALCAADAALMRDHGHQLARLQSDHKSNDHG